MRVVQRGEQPRLALEPVEQLGVVVPRQRQDLQRDVASEAGVARPIDLTHAAHAEAGDDFVGADASGRFERHAAAEST